MQKWGQAVSQHLLFSREDCQGKHENIVSNSKWLKAEMRLCKCIEMVWHKFACFCCHIQKRDGTEREPWQHW